MSDYGDNDDDFRYEDDSDQDMD